MTEKEEEWKDTLPVPSTTLPAPTYQQALTIAGDDNNNNNNNTNKT